jgi:YbbR domain-containing protein
MERIRQLLSEAGAFVWTLVWPMARSVRQNAGLASVSIVLAFALWVFVTDNEDTTRSGVLPFDVPVETVNVPGDLALAGSPVNVRVRVQVAQDVWDTLAPADFEATVDLDDLQAGTYDLPVKVEPQTSRGNLRVIEVIPATVPVELKSLFSKSVSISVNLEAAPPPGYAAGVPEVDAETVLVTGTQDNVSRVTQAVATLDLSARTENTQQAVRLEPRDSRGFLVEGVALEPSVVNVSVTVEQVEFSRALVISPEVVGQPASGYNVVSVSSEPAVATVFGPQSFVGDAATIRTQPVDISGAEGDVVRTVSLDLPGGVSVSGGTSVTVTVEIEPAQGRHTIAVTAVVSGLATDLSVSGPLPLIEVSLLGELPTLRELKPNDITATLNLSGLKAGTHQVKVDVSVPPGVTLAGASPGEVSLTLEAE